MSRVAPLLLCLVFWSCVSSPARPPARDPDTTRARAALATLVVDNRSPENVTILYRHTGRAQTEVAIGQVASRTIAQLAPVPAGEPLVLLARTDEDLEFVLAPRSFTIDGLWTWVVPADARFAPRGGNDAVR